MAHETAWKTDNYTFVGKSFDYAYANRMKKMLPILGEESGSSVDYELTGSGGYGELQPYDGTNLNKVQLKRGFKTIITPGEFSISRAVGRKEARIDKMGICSKVGKQLGDSGSMTVYSHVMRAINGAFDPKRTGGDGKSWAAKDHPVASLGSEGRRFLPDPESGTYSNLGSDILSVAAISAAQSRAGRFVTPDGLPFMCELDTVLVSIELEGTARKLFGPDSRLTPERDPEDDSNAANPLYGMKYIVVGGGKEGFSGQRWAVCDRSLMKEMFKIYYGERPTVLQSDLDNPLIDLYTAYADFGIGWGDARQIIFFDPN